MAVLQKDSGKYYCKIPGKPSKICIQDGQPTGAVCDPLPPSGDQMCSYGGLHGQVTKGNLGKLTVSRKQNPIFDYVVKQTNKGKSSFYGAFIEGDIERLVPIPGEVYAKLTGRMPVSSKNGIFRFYKPRKSGIALRTHIRQIAVDNGYDSNAIAAAIRLLPLLETALMDLEHKNVPIADRNNPFEVFIKYIYHNPQYNHIVDNSEYQALLHSMHGRNDLDFTELLGAGAGGSGGASGTGSSGGFDFSGMVGGLLNMFGTLFQQGQSVSNQAELNQWIAAYKNYMQVDFGDIDRELREHGAQAALDWLLRLKSTSWNDLKQYNINWCQSHGVPIPSDVIALQNAQKDLETTLRQMIAGGGTGTTPNQDGTAPFSHTGGSSIGSYWWIIGLGILALFLLRG